MKWQSLPPGYTQNHGNLKCVMEHYKKKAGNTVGNSIMSGHGIFQTFILPNLPLTKMITHAVTYSDSIYIYCI